MPIVTILPNETFCPEGAQIEVKTGAKLAQALNAAGIKIPHACEYRSEERRVGKECRSRWSPYH